MRTPPPWSPGRVAGGGPARPLRRSPVPVVRPRPRTGPLTTRLSAWLRVPSRYDPAPAAHRLVGLAAWAALLGVIGLAVALRALLAVVTGVAPGWFKPAVLAIGVLGIALTVAGFMAVHQRHLPWVLLGAASATLAVNLIVAVSI